MNRIFWLVLLGMAVLLLAGCLPDMPGPLGIPGI